MEKTFEDISVQKSDPLDDKRLSGTVGANIKRLRVQAHIKKKTFALMVGVGRPFLDRVEKGEADPRLSVLVRMADALETTPAQLMDTDSE